ncbi:MAG: D-2-hydroxyacid dehydrogenase [Clostridiales bacterium]|nr:D-2-hydroxyacid dehydrogenase [Clostridiales bacterium]
MNILVTIPMDSRQRQTLAAIAPEAAVRYTTGADVTVEEVAQAEIILGNVPIPLLQNAKCLKWLQLNFAGSDNYAAPGVLPEGVLLTNASGAYGLAISECMLAGVLHLIKHLDRYQRNQGQHLWHDEGQVSSIEGSTTLVVGLGDIGGSFARRMHALGSTVIGIRRNVTDRPDYLSALYQMDALDQLLPLVDFVSLSLPNSPQTRKIIGPAQLARMKDTAILINVGRGSAVDTEALNDALRSGEIGGAVLDVVDPEPLPPEHPLWDAPHLLLTPHVSGNYNLPETLRRVVNIALRNLAAYLNGQPMESVVDRATGYRRIESAR